MLYKCLLSTMSEEGHAKMTVWKSKYHVGTHPSRVLLKVMIRELHIDTNATASSIRHQMANLKDYIIKVNCDIRVFNRHFQSLIKGLNSHGQQSTNLLVNLFAAYKAAKDKKFLKYIEDKESAHEEGADIMVPALLKYASNEYKILYEKSEWCAPSKEGKHIQCQDHLAQKTGQKNQNFVVVVLFQEEEQQARKHQRAPPAPSGWLTMSSPQRMPSRSPERGMGPSITGATLTQAGNAN